MENVKVRGQCANHIPCDTMKIVAAAFREQAPNNTLLFKSLDFDLQADGLASSFWLEWLGVQQHTHH